MNLFDLCVQAKLGEKNTSVATHKRVQKISAVGILPERVTLYSMFVWSFSPYGE